MFTEPLAELFTDFAELVVVNGLAVQAIFDQSTEVALGEVFTLGPSLRLPASAVPGVAEGQACTVRSAAYQIREVLQLPPDGALLRLVLARSPTP